MMFKKFIYSNEKWKIRVATNLWELWTDLSWKDAAISKERITQSSLNYLRHLMNGSRLVKKSRRESEHLRDLLSISGVLKMSLTISQKSDFLTRHNCNPFVCQWSCSLDPLDGLLLIVIKWVLNMLYCIYKVLTCIRLS